MSEVVLVMGLMILFAGRYGADARYIAKSLKVSFVRLHKNVGAVNFFLRQHQKVPRACLMICDDLCGWVMRSKRIINVAVCGLLVNG
ncbi:hypothetical protein [Candidatus Bathycorpusculum sp.]|uniref:hypothetical protein n=1 Tax=Candidatus Bathycorpusculum sp. TaxID=2994959 RepID=UPI002819AA60|nr:hypothetical protein [Candidatus Termitimicrobium sp.]MCL2431581.1 hypothetical protein [Candidatus Termitimicrobium sp.]